MYCQVYDKDEAPKLFHVAKKSNVLERLDHPAAPFCGSNSLLFCL